MSIYDIKHWVIGMVLGLGICLLGEYAERRMKAQWAAERDGEVREDDG